MITLTCSQCDKNLKVKDELAGKKVRCPQCKQALEVPLPISEDATVPPANASPPEEGATILPSWSPPPDAEPAQERERTMVHVRNEEEKDLAAATNYKVAGEIARGGMGAIMRAVDADIHREVAVKFLLNNADDRQRARFVEEAQITGQLEHPNIVPIHQLGMDKDGQSFFSMKMVKGRSLAEILKDPSDEYTLGRLLNIMISICNALAYAHSRQVIHRDLKPANIMVGDFGEVYVMDWGLAKVRREGRGARGEENAQTEETPAKNTAIRPRASRVSGRASRVSGGSVGSGRSDSGQTADSRSQDKVTTRGRSQGELTQAGAIMGTPAYMPPEQARGELDDVDERSDIYSLGAILYEMMTLTPPVGRGGDMIAILMRVVEGKIDPPVERAPERARAGWVPPELSAIALKALARNPKHRYPSVEKLKRDIELFLEGRSVSAKQDTFREMAWKLLKRNKGASITAAVALAALAVIGGFFLKFNYDARVLAETQRGKAEKAYQDYQDQVRASVPAFLRAAKLALNERQFDDALDQASVAAKSAPDNAEARLLRGKLLITRKRYPEAITELEECLKLGADKATVQKLADLCRKAQTEKTGSPEETGSLLVLADIFTQTQEHALADGVLSGLGVAKNAPEVRQRLLEIYRKQIGAAWPAEQLTMTAEGRFTLGLQDSKIGDLTPLRGLPLTTLGLDHNDQIRDLTPLKGMPLTTLHMFNCTQIRDLTPLQGMPLQILNIDSCAGVRDLTPLQGMPLQQLDMNGCQVRDLTPLQGMPLQQLDMNGCQVRDLTPLQGMPLQRLQMNACSQVRDLTPLQGMPLQQLILSHCGQVRDFTPLKGMPLTALYLNSCQIRDLKPLQGMPLMALELSGSTEFQDLMPLKGMPLTTLYLENCTQIHDLMPLKGMPLKILCISRTGVSALKPLQGMELEDIRLTPKNITQGLDILRGMKSLKRIGINDMVWPPAEFWDRYEKGEFKK